MLSHSCLCHFRALQHFHSSNHWVKLIKRSKGLIIYVLKKPLTMWFWTLNANLIININNVYSHTYPTTQYWHYRDLPYDIVLVTLCMECFYTISLQWNLLPIEQLDILLIYWAGDLHVLDDQLNNNPDIEPLVCVRCAINYTLWHVCTAPDLYL